MAKVDTFLDALINYDKENIHPEIIKAIEPYLKDSEFEPEFVRSKSAAAAGLCAWVINIIKFYEVFCDVEPKRKALVQANVELAAAQEKLSVIKKKVVVSGNLERDLTISCVTMLKIYFAKYFVVFGRATGQIDGGFRKGYP